MLDGFEEARTWIFERAAKTETEQGLDELLREIKVRIEEAFPQPAYDADVSADEAGELLASVIAWTSAVSHAVALFYAPASPWPTTTRLAGWSQRIGRLLRTIVGILNVPLRRAMKALDANSCSISVGFPWGVSVGLSWD